MREIFNQLLPRESWSARSCQLTQVLVTCLIFAITSQLTFGYPKAPRGAFGDDGYAVMESRLEFTDVSASYARSIYKDVRVIVHGYLADEKLPYSHFFDYNPYVEGKPLDLLCEVKRLSNEIHLSVRITRYETQDVLLSFDMTVPFFRPEVAVAAFATSFPEKFSQPVVRQHSYVVPPQGFNAGPTK